MQTARSAATPWEGSGTGLKDVTRVLAGAFSLEDGTLLRATSRLATLALRIPIAADEARVLELEVMEMPPGPLVVGTVGSLAALSEAAGATVGRRENSLGFGLHDGTVLLSCDSSGVPPVPTFADGKAAARVAYAVVVDRPRFTMSLFRGKNKVAEVPLAEGASPALLGITIAGPGAVRLRLGNGWEPTSLISAAEATPLGSFLAPGNVPGSDLP